MKIVAWAPIKMNNERLPGKNTLPLAGHPLCQRVLGELLKLDGVDDVCVYCSEEEIEQYIQPEVKRIPRDESLNSFCTKINDVIRSFVDLVDADIYVYAQVTSPFLKSETIQKGLDAVIKGGYDSALSVKSLKDFLWRDGEPLNYDPANIARTQDLAPIYQETGGFYIFTKELVQKFNRRTRFQPFFAEVSEIEAVDIDYYEDYELAQSIVLKDCGRPNDAYNVALLSRWVKFCEEGRTVNDGFELFGSTTCAIYGTGVIGRCLYDAIDKHKVDVKYFIDRQSKEYDGVRCIVPEDVPAQEPVDIIIVTPGFDYHKIKAMLGGVTARIISIDMLLDNSLRYDTARDIDELKIVEQGIKNKYSALFQDYAISQKVWELGVRQFLIRCINMQAFLKPAELRLLVSDMYMAIFSHEVTLPLIDLVITTRCSLKCKKCFHLIPQYTKNGNKPFDMELEQILKDLKKLQDSVGYIFKVNLLGGEPFLYPRLAELLSRLLSFDKVGYYQIVTNSTIVPDDQVCEILRNYRFFVFINDYGVNSKADQLAAKFDSFGICYHRADNRVWYDFGNLKQLHLTQKELTAHYARCSYSKCKALMDGELHVCAFHKHGQRVGLLPDCGDSLHIHNYSNAELREEIVSFYRRPYFEACGYCNAPDQSKAESIIAGEQE